jgi:mannosyl-oligosaccharide alpha-1,2-mannosidase
VVSVSSQGLLPRLHICALVPANGYSTNAEAHDHRPSGSIVLAVLGTLQLEFTRLSQLTGNAKYYSAVQNVMDELEKWQNETSLPGMWPAMVDSTTSLGSPSAGGAELFTLGALSDSAYEYLPKVLTVLPSHVDAHNNIHRSNT